MYYAINVYTQCSMTDELSWANGDTAVLSLPPVQRIVPHQLALVTTLVTAAVSSCRILNS